VSIYELRYEVLDEEGTGSVHSVGARATREEAERLLHETRAHDKEIREARARHPESLPGGNLEFRYWIEEVDTTGLFEIPSRPTPRERFSTRVRVTSEPHLWEKVHVDILDGERIVANYDRNYAMLQTFEPFRQGDRHFALIAPKYTATSVMDLDSGEIIAGEEPDSWGFCPVGFYVPDWWDVHPSERPHVRARHPPGEPFLRPGTLMWRDEYEWPSRGDFGFVWGCIWGDDSSWKLQYLDLSGIQDGVMRREERFGYVKLATSRQLDAREFIRVRGPRHVEFAIEKEYDLLTGREFTDEWDPYDEVEAASEADDQAS
jgi:hypothetical protein